MNTYSSSAESSRNYSAMPPPPPTGSSGFGGVDNNNERLNVEDALSYLDRVKETFKHQPHVYNDFVDAVKQFKAQTIGTQGVMTKVCHLFKNHPELFDGFNSFLPDGYKIEVQHYPQGHGYQVLMSVPTHFVPETTPETEPPTPDVVQEEAVDDDVNCHYGESIPAISNGVVYDLQEEIVQDKPPAQQIQFNDAMFYVNKIKNRFETQPAKYKRFLEILHNYQTEQKNFDSVKPGGKLVTVNDVYNQVSELFEPGDDLLEEFGRFFPD